MDRLISLSVSVEDEQFTNALETMTEFMTELAESYRHDYISLSSSEFKDELDEEVSGEDLYHDENTLVKARMAMARILQNHRDWTSEDLTNAVTEMVNELHNDGILFRERKPS
jgi:hypothetical protein